MAKQITNQLKLVFKMTPNLRRILIYIFLWPFEIFGFTYKLEACISIITFSPVNITCFTLKKQKTKTMINIL